MTGFLAAIYMRGIRYVQIPTTFLAQVDSSIGGKTRRQSHRRKKTSSAASTIRKPFSPTPSPRTLPPPNPRRPQESIKAGVIYDAKLFRYMEQNADAILAGNPTALTRRRRLLRVKADVVSKDEKESGLRMILNSATPSATPSKPPPTTSNSPRRSRSLGKHRRTQRSRRPKNHPPKDATASHNSSSATVRLPPFKATAEKLVASPPATRKTAAASAPSSLPTAIGKTEIVRQRHRS